MFTAFLLLDYWLHVHPRALVAQLIIAQAQRNNTVVSQLPGNNLRTVGVFPPDSVLFCPTTMVTVVVWVEYSWVGHKTPIK